MDDDVAEFAHGDRLRTRIAHFIQDTPSVMPLVVLTLSVLVFGLLLGDKFFSPFALTLILSQVAIVGIVAVAQSIVIITAGIDLAVGAIAVLTTVVMGKVSIEYGLPPPLAIVAGLAFGTLAGSISGILVAYVKLPPFIVTLGMWQVVLATNFIYSGSEVVRAQVLEVEAPLLQFFGKSVNIGDAVFTYGVLFMLLLMALMAYVLSQTAWGRHVYAVGDDLEAAELSGVNVKATLVSVYAVAGLICGFAGWVLIGRIGSIAPQALQLANIESITAVVIGGISLFGGRGSVIGAVLGAVIVGVFTLGLRLLGLDVQWTYLLIGILIIGAVTIDQYIRKVS